VCQSAKLRALDRAEHALALADFDAALRESTLQTRM
jgi:hypothetical protein